MKYIFGSDIGGTTVKLGLFTRDGELLETWEITTDRSNGGMNVPQDIKNAIYAKMEEKGIELADVLGLGIGVPGPVKADGTVLKCANLGWDIFNVNDHFTKLCGFPCKAANDANVAALGEYWQGGGKGMDNIMMVTLGTGVGGGLILDGKIVAGVHGGAGEIGHIRVNDNETRICGCGGHGHLEQYASATGIAYMARACGMGDVTAKDVFDKAKAGDETALKVIEDMAEVLTMALSHVAASVDVEAFVIGGGVSKAGDILLDALKRHYGPNLLNALQMTQFRLATLGNLAGIYGCACMMKDEK